MPCTLCTIRSAQTQSDKGMEELEMFGHLNALTDIEQGHSKLSSFFSVSLDGKEI